MKKIKQFCMAEHKLVILCLLLMTCMQVLLLTGGTVVYAYDNAGAGGLAERFSNIGIRDGFISIVAVGLDPIFAIAALLLDGNVGIGLTIFFVALCVVKVLFTTFRGLNLFCDNTLGRAEEVIGTVTCLSIGFLSSTAVVVYASNTPVAQSTHGVVATFFLTVLGFIVSVLSYVAYVVIRSMIKAFEAMAFLFALFPGGYQIMQWFKYGFVLFYTALGILSPVVAAALGLVILAAAALLFRITSRLRRYFHRIYIRPVLRSVFMSHKEFPLVMPRAPRPIRGRFSNMHICQEAYVINGAGKIPLRERVYFVCDDAGAYVCRCSLFRKLEIIPLPPEYLYGEKKARFMTLYVKKHGAERPMLQIVLRRELNRRFDEICGIVKFQIPEVTDSYIDRLKSVGLFFRGRV